MKKDEIRHITDKCDMPKFMSFMILLSSRNINHSFDGDDFYVKGIFTFINMGK
jgi:hypothetical protein